MPNWLRKGWIVVFAGFCINLTFGCLYTWSIFSANLSNAQGWTASQAAMPYTTAIGVFALVILLGGNLQDRFGPKIVTIFSGIFIGLGLIVCGLFPTLYGIVLGFGVITGSGIGLGYASVAPAALKWFEPNKKGMIVGIVLTGFGLAPLYVAPLTRHLISVYGIFTTFKLLGILFGVTVVLMAQCMNNPPETESANEKYQKLLSRYVDTPGEYTWKAMVRTNEFYLLWVMYLFGAMTGLMLMGHMAKILQVQTGSSENVVLMVAAFSISNALGRPTAGFISDKLGRGRTMAVLYIVQGLTLLMLSRANTFFGVFLASIIITYSYGAMLTVFPSAIGDFYGTKNLGFNYALLFTAWGVAGIFGPQLAGYLLDVTGGYTTIFYICAAANIGAAFIGIIVKSPNQRKMRVIQRMASA
ncbi:MAG: Nitrate/nitrite transporter NarK [Burkholderiaceae bacterium]|nr:Nitrate/nitrite transporter NarK [Burkholderiaceae bacterium]